MNCTLNITDYDRFVEIYNEYGRQAAQNYVTNDCGVEYDTFQRKMRNGTSYVFNRSTRKFVDQNQEAEFMSLDDLCNTKARESTAKSVPSVFPNNVGFDELVLDLMRGRLIEMYRFINFDQSSRQIIVNSRAVKESGYSLSVI